MDTQAFFFLVLSLMVSGTYSAKLTFTNKCSYTIWPGTLNNADKPRLSSTGFELATGVSKSIDAPVPWGGRFWARTGCSTTASKFACSTADCGSGQIECNGAGAIPPATLAEVTIVTGGGMDFYDVSLVDGFNLPISITPQGGLSGCNSTSCAANVNAVCPSEFIVKGSDGSTIGCRSACDVLKDPKYCCTGSYGSPTTCLPTNYSKIFKDACPQAYSYAYDDKTSTFTCTGGANYLITFCP